jgi:hypothetical protein
MDSVCGDSRQTKNGVPEGSKDKSVGCFLINVC